MIIQFILKTVFRNKMLNLMTGKPVPTWFRLLVNLSLPFMILEAFVESIYYTSKNLYNIGYSLIDMRLNSYKLDCRFRCKILLLSYYVSLAVAEKLNNEFDKDAYESTTKKIRYDLSCSIKKYNISESDICVIEEYYKNRLC